jgi:hypothetical protein
LPRDGFASLGWTSNRCYVFPSLDFVVARVSAGRSMWHEQFLIGQIVDAIVSNGSAR